MYSVTYMDGGRKAVGDFFGTEKEIREKLLHEGKIVLSIKKPLRIWGQGVAKEEIVAAFTAMGDLLGSGVPLTKTLTAIIESLGLKSKLAPVLVQIRGIVSAGRPFSQGMEQFKYIFNSTIIAMAIAGENAGKLPETLLTVAEHIRQMSEIKSEMFKKLTYPLVVFVFGFVSLFVNSAFVIPKILSSDLYKMAQKNNNDGDVSIQILLLISKIAPFALIAAVLLVFVFIYLFQRHQEKAERIIEKIPLVREFVFYQGYYVAFSSLANLVHVGVRLDTAFQIVGQSARLIMIRNQFEEARQALREGTSFVKGFKSIDAIEKTMLETAQNMDRVQKNFDLIAKRFHRLYIEKVKSIGPKIYGLVMIMGFGIFMLMLMGVMMPYFKSMGGIK